MTGVDLAVGLALVVLAILMVVLAFVSRNLVEREDSDEEFLDDLMERNTTHDQQHN